MAPTKSAISKKAQDFWTLLKSFPKQIDLPLDQQREFDQHSEDFTSEPEGVKFASIPELNGVCAELPDIDPGRTILYFFGGGYVIGSPDTRRKTAGHLAKAANVRVLVPSYRLAPEHPFPAAVDDAVRAYQWALAHGAESTKTIVAGDSSGGGLAVATVLAARDRNLPLPAGIVAISPWTDLTCSGDTMSSRAETDIECNRDGLLRMAGWYRGDTDARHPLISPVFADLAGLPPLLGLVGGDETLLDDTIRLVRNAGMAGVDATAFVAAGMQHIFPIWAGSFPEADAAIALIGDWVRKQIKN